MPVITAGKREEGFMTIRRLLYCLFFILPVLSSCETEIGADTIPPITFDDIFVNLSLPEYNDLITKGYMYIPSGGRSRGIILYRSGNNYLAYERTCSYLPYEATSIVDVNVAGTAMTDYSCNSVFNFQTGFPEAGPAINALQQYRTILDGGFLTITDEVVN